MSNTHPSSLTVTLSPPSLALCLPPHISYSSLTHSTSCSHSHLSPSHLPLSHPLTLPLPLSPTRRLARSTLTHTLTLSLTRLRYPSLLSLSHRRAHDMFLSALSPFATLSASCFPPCCLSCSHFPSHSLSIQMRRSTSAKIIFLMTVHPCCTPTTYTHAEFLKTHT